MTWDAEDWRPEWDRYQELKKQLQSFTDPVALEVFGEVMKHFVMKNGEIRTGSNWHKSLQQLYLIKVNELKKAQDGQ